MEVVVAVVSCTYPVVFVLQGIAEQLDVRKKEREREREGGRERICMFYSLTAHSVLQPPTISIWIELEICCCG